MVPVWGVQEPQSPSADAAVEDDLPLGTLEGVHRRDLDPAANALLLKWDWVRVRLRIGVRIGVGTETGIGVGGWDRDWG